MRTLQARRRVGWPLAIVLPVMVAIVLAVSVVADRLPWSEESISAPNSPVITSRRQTDTDSLIANLQQRLKANPEDFNSHILLANAYLQRVRESGDPTLYSKTENLLNRAAVLQPERPALYATRGMLALGRHEFAQALELGRQALRLDPGNPQYLGIVGDAQIELGQYDEAVKSYQAMVNGRPDFSAFVRVAHARELYGDLDGAIQAMEYALQAGGATPENWAWAYVQLGHLRFTQGDMEGAAEDYERAHKVVPDYPPALAGQARIAAAADDLETAAQRYQRAFDLMSLPEYAIALVDVHTAAGNHVKARDAADLVAAIESLHRANGVNTDLEIALFNADHGRDLATSLERARAAYAAAPSIHAADVLAWTLYKSGNYQEAQRHAAEALKLGTQDPLKLFHAGMIAEALGQHDQARAYLQQAVTLNRYFSVLHSERALTTLRELGGSI